ncbi:Bifunctional non-homologous end joining protein LigD [Neomoorella glycerini]|uniref:Bifunctional non-homologous end joining protein LigD n=1 Tax=Neomoorella glycerini TaxID=55779 RepID=A0A6I5ZN46_9FIRM|nr:Bifunctional non-homologous end joining protein LigD [Moorella glycerini]
MGQGQQYIRPQLPKQQLQLTNPHKVFWPEGLTKFDLVEYYVDMAPVILPYLRDRPLVLKRYPDGITGEAFYQKECPAYAPEWVATLPVYHADSDKTINYVLCNNEETLAWLANQGCIEVHAWLSRAGHLECPDIAVMDLDPAARATFADVLEIALLVNQALKEFHLTGYPKTSGASGLHIFIPLFPRWTFQEVTAAMGYIAQLIVEVYPQKATTAHPIQKRQDKVYLDYLQNVRGRSMAFPYSLRPLPGAPVSTPLTWEEVAGKKIRPGDFNIHTVRARLEKYGDLYRDLLEHPNNLEPLLELAGV